VAARGGWAAVEDFVARGSGDGGGDRVGRPSAAALQHRIALVKIDPEGYVAFGETVTTDEADVGSATIGHAGGGTVGFQAQAIHLVLQHDVHSAGDGVGAVLRLRPVLQHFDTIDEGCGNVVQVHRLVGLDAAENEAAAIDQHQGAVEIQVAQVDEVFAEAAIGLRGVHTLAAEGGQLVQQRAERGLAAVGDGLRPGKRGAGGILAAGGTRDGDLFGLLRQSGGGAGACQKCQRCRKKQG
jgi:hypothetical protein